MWSPEETKSLLNIASEAGNLVTTVNKNETFFLVHEAVLTLSKAPFRHLSVSGKAKNAK